MHQGVEEEGSCCCVHTCTTSLRRLFIRAECVGSLALAPLYC